MPKGYQHLTRDQRCQIETLKASGFLQSEIAKRLGVHSSTISRELRRNRFDGRYHFHDADRTARIRRWKASKKPKRMTKKVLKRIHRHLQEQWSPEQISGRLKLKGINVSHESIYKYIWESKRLGGTLHRHLRRYRKKYNKRGWHKRDRAKIPNRKDIQERPAIVESKSRIGDWEGDTIIGARHNSAILSYVERKSKMTILERINRKTAQNVFDATIKRFTKFPTAMQTVTYDNGTEFAMHELISQKTGICCYFARPYHAWERGLNEHTNGLVRQYFPKSTDFKEVTDEEISRVENLLNNRPRKALGYLTPKEVFNKAIKSTRLIALQG